MPDHTNRILSADHSFTIDEFCTAERISRAQYYVMRRAGLGPREMRHGRAVRISPQARHDWHRTREAASATISTTITAESTTA